MLLATQLEAVDEMVQSAGKTILTFVSVPCAPAVSIHALPDIAAPVECLLILTNDCVIVAFAFLGRKIGWMRVTIVTIYNRRLITEFLSFNFNVLISATIF